jgi:uncharacterized protein YegP (UPF0339 family)
MKKLLKKLATWMYAKHVVEKPENVKRFAVIVQKSSRGLWYWRLVSVGNNETLATSEEYSSLNACMDTAEMVCESMFFCAVLVLK